ncbi:hypothetical protein GGI43DRAFT_405556 [Trichoderma evansii]
MLLCLVLSGYVGLSICNTKSSRATTAWSSEKSARGRRLVLRKQLEFGRAAYEGAIIHASDLPSAVRNKEERDAHVCSCKRVVCNQHLLVRNLALINARLRPHFLLGSSQETSLRLEEFQSLCGIIIVDVFVWGKWVEGAVQLWSWPHGCDDASR